MFRFFGISFHIYFMTITQLEYLLAVANYGNFTTAAEKCFVTQPSLSIQIKNLEEELGLILLDRSKKPVVPTDAGNRILEIARETVTSISRIKECAQECKGNISGTLKLGFIPTISPYIVDKLVPVILKKYPDIHLQIYESVTADLIEKLQKDQLDASVMATGFSPENIHECTIMKDPFFLFASPEHPLYRQNEVDLGEIDRSDLLLLTEGHCLRQQIINLCPKSSPKETALSIECGSIETLIKVTLATGKTTIIPSIALPSVREPYKTCIKPLVNADAYRNISVAVSRTYAKKNLIAVLTNELTHCCQSLKQLP